ncbi:MAG TPA: Trm112 family protein [Longimicrobiales bacterium]|nr:Trm112 family protein [Longimicrobiales bacterium]
MHLLLTDRLSCPRCGPQLGLILRADRMESRLVMEGVLGCPNCRDAFAVVDGFADLRAPPRDPLGEGLAGPPPETVDASPAEAERADRLVALLAVVGGPGTIALVGEPARLALRVAAALPELLVAAVDPDLRHWPEVPEVSRLAAAPGLPFFGSTLRAVAVDGRLGAEWLREAARVVQPRARVVVLHAPEGATATLEASGLTVLAAEAETVVAARG